MAIFCCFFFDNYTLYYDHCTTHNGGVDVKGIRNDLKLQGKINEDKNYQVENIWLECSIPNVTKNIIIGNIYRHPGGNIQFFTEKLNDTVNKINKEDKICLICGDLNINTINTKHKPTVDFLDTMLSENFIPQITLPTRITENSSTLIDHILLKYDKNSINENVKSGNIYNDISDHLPNFILLGERHNCTSNKKRKYIRVLSEKNMKRYKNYLQEQETWTRLQNISDCNLAFDIYFKIINEGYDKYFPLKMISRKREKDKKWMTSGLRKSCAGKSKLYKKYLSKPTYNNRLTYNRYRNLLSKVCRLSREHYYENIINETKSSLKNLWKVFGPIINPARNKNSCKIDKIKINGQVLDNENEIANHFNSYFCNIGKKLADKICSKETDLKKYMKNPNPNSIFISPVTESELYKIISKLNTNKSIGLIDIPTKVFKNCFHELKQPLMTIIYLSLQNGSFPDIYEIS